MVKSKIVKEWFNKGEKDITNAEFLFKGNRDLETVAFHIQQSAEKYLKGFLISRGKELERIHDLVKLLQDVIKIDTEFNQFKGIVKKITNFYFESRYPLGKWGQLYFLFLINWGIHLTHVATRCNIWRCGHQRFSKNLDGI
ncbi:hypothetical protein B9J78_06230 [bacterium Unc6]|nr:hypothetical protein [bacterium Unc6]MBT9129961.1 hypothetical protein [Candidatus Psychracetigena formicireducens]